jgi:drug/metabolite transporter (DMT)-like permease
MQKRLGPTLAVIGVLGFSFKAILVKLAYTTASIDAVTLLALVFTIALGFWILGEPVRWIQLAGVALVLAGVTLVTLRPKA